MIYLILAIFTFGLLLGHLHGTYLESRFAEKRIAIAKETAKLWKQRFYEECDKIDSV